jgi:glycolate oxidase subunit GlcD
MTVSGAALRTDLAGVAGAAAVREPRPEDLRDATESRGWAGHADAVVAPEDAAGVAAVLRWSDAHDVAVTPRGGGTGLSGGAVPLHGGIVLSLERLRAVRTLEPERWRMHVEAGITTAHVRRLAREQGLYYPVDPGAADQSHLGGNVATNAGGPHAFKYGVTSAWVTGLEVVLPPGEVVELGGDARKDVAPYDLVHLLCGSEGTLGVVTAVRLRLVPAPEAALPVAGFYSGIAEGAAAVEAVMAAGIPAAALEYLEGAALSAAAGAFPAPVPDDARFMVVAEADGELATAAAWRDELREALAPEALAVHAPDARRDIEALWRWREGVSIAVTGIRGGKVSEDVAVPVEHLGEAIVATLAIGERHGLEACSWGHAGDGNLHSTFLLDRRDAGALERAEAAAHELFELAARLGGTVSGEHGIGAAKLGQLEARQAPAAVAAQRAIKAAFDPKGLLNPGKKLLG